MRVTSPIFNPTTTILSKDATTTRPSTFKQLSLEEKVELVNALLNNQGVTEKVAGQHCSISVRGRKVLVNTKDRIGQGKPPQCSKTTSWGGRLIVKHIHQRGNGNADYDWCFEMVHPKSNHDFINYKNVLPVYYEYTGTLSPEQAQSIASLERKRKFIIITRQPVLVDKTHPSFLQLSQQWFTGKEKLLSPDRRGKYKRLRELVGQYVNSCRSCVDGQTPVEGVVVRLQNGKTVKIQSLTYLSLQKVQLPMYSVMKLKDKDKHLVSKHASRKFSAIEKKKDADIGTILTKNKDKSLMETVKEYLEKNSKLVGIDKRHYKQWLTPDESKGLLHALNVKNVAGMYQFIHQRALA